MFNNIGFKTTDKYAQITINNIKTTHSGLTFVYYVS